MANIGNYQGGGDIVLTKQTDGVLNAIMVSEERKRKEAKEKELREEQEENVFLENLSKTMAGVTTKGLQQKDIPGFQKIYGEMEDAYVRAYQTKDKATRLKEMAKVKQLATQATLYTQQSEEVGKKKTEYLKQLQNSYEKYDADSALKALNAHYDRPLSEITTDFDILQYRNKWDSAKVDKALTDVKKELLSSSANIIPHEQLIASTPNGYDTVNTFRTTRTIPKADAINSFKVTYQMNPDFKRYIDTEFDGTLDSKLDQLYGNLTATNWHTDIKDEQRVQGRAPVRSSGGGRGGSSSDDAEPEVYGEVDLAYSYNNTVTANKHVAFKGDSIKARVTKGVRAYDMTTGEPLEITTGMGDGVVQELAQLPTADLRGKGRRILVKGTEKGRVDKYEDFAVVKIKKPVYTFATGDLKGEAFTKTGAELQKAISSGKVKRTAYEEVNALFPMESVMPPESTLTKGEAKAYRTYKNSVGPKTAPKKQSKTLSVL